MTTPLAQLQDIVMQFDGTSVIDKLSLLIGRGACTVLLGPSGSGKTTLLSLIGGFLTPTSGKILIDGSDMTNVPPARRPTTTVFQDYALFPNLTAGGNVTFGLRMRGVGRAERTAKALETLRFVGLETVFDHLPHQLSGGQRQRVALARALVVQPLMLLLDEPLGALDLKLRRQMQDELKALRKRLDATFVHVTHDQEEAMALADTLVVMNAGHIEDEGPPERVYSKPATLFTARFMGEVTTFPGHCRRSGTATLRLESPLGTHELPSTGQPEGPVTVAIRPEAMGIGKAVNGLLPLGPLRVRDVVYQGAHKRILGETGPASAPVETIVRLPPGVRVRPGELVPLLADPDAVLVYVHSG